MDKKINSFAVLKMVAVLCIFLLVSSFARQAEFPEPKEVDGKVIEISYSKIVLIDDKGEEQSFTLSEGTRVQKLIPIGSEELKQNLYLHISGKVDDKSINADAIGIMRELTSEMMDNMKYSMGAETLEKFTGGKFCQVKSINPLEVEDLNAKKFSVKVSPKTEIHEVLSSDIGDIKKDDTVNLRIIDLSEMGYGTLITISVLKEK